MHRMGGTGIQIVLGALDDRKSIMDLDPEDVIKTLSIRAKYGYYVVVHGKYIYNFCRENWRWQEDCLFQELKIAAKINADVVIHQGKNVSELKLDVKSALDVYAAVVTRVAKRMKAAGLKNRIILENSSRQGTELGYSLEQLAQIYEAIPDEFKPYIGFCIDTCHIFVAGEEDWKEPEALFHRFDTLIGLQHLKVVHLNDSAIPFNGRNDHHAGIGKGHIAKESLHRIVKYCNSRNIPMILETPITGMQEEIALFKAA
jgi:deoxyribonuclease-4